jgi:hypothetical protein
LCAQTAPGYNIAWFQVDLGKMYSLKSVRIYIRREGIVNKLAHIFTYYSSIFTFSALVFDNVHVVSPMCPVDV